MSQEDDDKIRREMKLAKELEVDKLLKREADAALANMPVPEVTARRVKLQAEIEILDEKLEASHKARNAGAGA